MQLVNNHIVFILELQYKYVCVPLAGTENMHQHPLKKQHNHSKVYKRSPAHAMPQMP